MNVQKAFFFSFLKKTKPIKQKTPLKQKKIINIKYLIMAINILGLKLIWISL